MPAIWRARDIMVPNTIFIAPDKSVADASKIAAGTDAKSFLVGSDGLFSGLVRRDEIEEAVRLGKSAAPLHSILIKDYPHVYPDQPLEVVIERLGNSPGLLPVVSRGEPNHVQGVITPQRLIQFLQSSLQQQSRLAAATDIRQQRSASREKPAA